MATKIDRRLLYPEKKNNETLTEKEEWAKYGCNNNKEWHEFLNQCMWKEYTSDIKSECYIGTHESNLTSYRRHKKDDVDFI